ncbi:LysM peptidoglycan-binding domain-containing protein [Actinoplanes missouriensis]|uniref:LysM peptidoglycan-binding domain-containing protein n=1 Tax=Actinoplanes missouriensis TaxID=1866 RepID=UPI0033EAAFF2
MARLSHGKVITEEDLIIGRAEVAAFSATSATATFALTGAPPPGPFDLLFPDLQDDPENLVEQTPQTTGLLAELGTAMADPDRGDNGEIPAVYTYFGQFVDHDITLEVQKPGNGIGSGSAQDLVADGMQPMSLDQVRTALRNGRTAALDLDSLYDPPAPVDPKNHNLMEIGTNADVLSGDVPFKQVPGKDNNNDLPRLGRNAKPELDRAAEIGDGRNDENTIISQLHLAFLKAHNALVKQGMSFEVAQRTLRQHYQHIVVHDFLSRVCEKEIVDDIVKNGNRWFNPYGASFFMPLEFSVAAYRFGHSMVRGTYNFNVNFRFGEGTNPATLEDLFTFTALSGQLRNLEKLPNNWIIQWENIAGENGQKARKIDTTLARVGDQALFNLQTLDGKRETPDLAARLAVRNLLRGYRLRIPTGQAVAKHLGVPVLTPQQLLDATGDVNGDQARALRKGSLLTRTPLWYYILAEAQVQNRGARLGTVGSTIVADVLIGLVRRSTDSILRIPGWRPTLPAAKPGTFELPDLLRLAGVLGAPVTTPPQPATYTVKSGDTLSGIARSQLGDEKRWPQIYVLNRKQIRDPNRIIPGQVLQLPPKQPVGAIPRLYTVKRGDTLFGIAKSQLGDGNRWPEIFRLNRDVLDNPDRIVPGQTLILPS